MIVDISIVVPCYNEVENIHFLVNAIHKILPNTEWEIIFVDDNSPDGTIHRVRELAEKDPHVRGLLRIGRKGLSSAVIEGILSSSAPVVVVMDGDLQHDESCIPAMLHAIQKDGYDVVVASRHVEGGSSSGLSNKWRHILSRQGILLAKKFSVPVEDPMSGFFAIRRRWFEKVSPSLSGKGFKILLEILFAAPKPIKVKEIPMVFRRRIHGESKLGPEVMFHFIVIIAKRFLKNLFSK